MRLSVQILYALLSYTVFTATIQFYNAFTVLFTLSVLFTFTVLNLQFLQYNYTM